MGKRSARIPLKDRLLRQADQSGECWIWLGRKSEGYGQIRVDGSTHYTHRLSYELFVGPIPDGLVIDHLCRNHACFNPQHLEPVRPGVNVLRGLAPTVETWRTGVCQRGHDLVADGYITQYKNGKQYRYCRKCTTWRERERHGPAKRDRRQAQALQREEAALAQLPQCTDPDDPAQSYLTTEQAAAAAHVKPSTIRDWNRRGLIVPIAHGLSNYYLELDVLAVEAKTRRGARQAQLVAEAMEALNTQAA